MAARRVAGGPRGRFRVAVILVTFVLVASAVIMRRTMGAGNARELLELSRKRASLVAERARLVSAIGAATSLSQLEPIVAQRLGMRRPSDGQLIRLPREVRRDP
ncbi:MAG: hypothetical protein IPK85_16760 [Gemmatimonadetes bacterium]|nr:hypothetical protein [Gemmatimonadota bacterium]